MYYYLRHISGIIFEKSAEFKSANGHSRSIHPVTAHYLNEISMKSNNGAFYFTPWCHILHWSLKSDTISCHDLKFERYLAMITAERDNLLC